MFTLSPDQWQALSPHLDEALGMTDEDRSAWLSSLRRQNPVVAHQLEMLLQEHLLLSEAGFLEQASVGLPGATGLAGQTVGVYTLLSQIGQGGMGSVWLAERNDGRFERRVAVKFLNIALVGKAGEERFKREGRILALLVHPHIAELVDAGVSHAGQPYLVLEHIEGDHIDRYCDQRNLGVAARIRIFLNVLGAVAKAHANLIVHRDLKASNVLVRNDGQVKLLDFGIAKLLEDEGTSGEAPLTIEGGRAMTPEFAAPEQLQGGSITTSTDIYALGVLLFVLLTGQHPAGAGPHTHADLVKAVVDTEPARPSEIVTQSRTNSEMTTTNATKRATTPDRLRRLLRGDLDTIVAKALKKDPCERYSSVTAMADDLRRYLRSEPIGARPDTIAYRAIKFVRRNRAVAALAAVAAVAMVAGTLGTLVQARTARIQRDFAVRQLTRAKRINDLNELLLSDVAPMGKPLTANDLLQREQHIIESEHYDNAANHVELLISIGGQYSGEEENARALRVLEQAYSLSRGLREPSTRARASCELAWALAPGGELSRAESLVQEGLRELPNKPQYGSDRALCLLRGSEIAYRHGDANEVISRAQAAERALKESPVRSPVEELNVLTTLAGAYGAAGQFREAFVAFEKASARMNDLGYGETQKAVRLFNDWALTLVQAGQPLEAEKAYRHAIEISQDNQTDEAVLPTLLHNYAGVLRELGRLHEAAGYAERAHARAQREGDEILVEQAALQRARIYRDQRDFARASAMLAEVEPRMRRHLPAGYYGFAALVSDKALLAQAKGDLPAALQLADQAVNIDEAAIKAGGQGAPYLPILLVRRSAVELEARQRDQAAADAARALSLLQTTTQPGTLSSSTGRAYLALGRALQSQGKPQEAHTAFRAAAEHLKDTLGANHPDTRSARQQAELGTHGP
jgi:eukaryotic-like serine/threonine-protein kinase